MLQSLDDSVMDKVKYLLIGGSSPSLLYSKSIFVMDGGRKKNVKIGRIMFLTDSIEGLMFYTLMLNHAGVVFSRKFRERFINKI